LNKSYIICGGPSLKDFNFELLKGCPIYAVNHSFEFIEELTGIVSIDAKFYKQRFKDLFRCGIPMYSVKGYDDVDEKEKLGVTEYKNTGVNGVDYGKGIRHGFNSGYTAICIAIKHGYTDIRVLGMDLIGKRHFYDLDKDRSVDPSYVIPHLQEMKRQLRPDIKITFYGEGADIPFERKQLDQVLI